MSIPALNTAVTGAQAAQEHINVITNNISNAQTPGFKAGMVTTEDLFYRSLVQAGVQNNQNQNDSNRPVGVYVGSGTRVNGVTRLMTNVGVLNTGNPLDLAITGPGYFQIVMPTYPNGRGFSRAGNFKLDNNRNIVTQRGELLSDNITVPQGVNPNSITIGSDGSVTAVDANNNPVPLGRITLYVFPNEQGLQPLGNDMLVETAGSGQAEEMANQTNSMIQKSLEKSNVSTVKELMALVESQRTYDLSVKIISTVTEMEETAIKAI
jgi:flagellar basal-body rod protein FlgG